ncbi:four helix bundle protein [Candidatus Saganbacteria bacterium]|nr:four helix bundle protein [Candidatus Saganbacteria bacterium]
MTRNIDIHDRLLKFGIRIVMLSRILAKQLENRSIADQLIRSGTSVGANMQEADAASSKRDFINKVNISKKEIQETNYWLKIIDGSQLINNENNKLELAQLLAESEKLKRIISAILFRSKENQYNTNA